MSPKKISIIVISALILIVALQNIELTVVRFLFWQFTISRVLIILGSFILGVLVGGYVKKWVRTQTQASSTKEEKPHPWQS